MDEKKDKISKKILDSLTMEDLWKSHNLREIIKNEYLRAYIRSKKTDTRHINI